MKNNKIRRGVRKFDFLWFDRLMSGDFKILLVWTAGATILGFLMFWG